MNRRDFLVGATSAMALSLNAATRSSGDLGVAWTSYMTVWHPQDTIEFLEHCHDLGAGGIQAPLHGDPVQIGKRAEQLGMYIEAAVTLPVGDDTSRFEQELKAARDAGAVALRAACLPTRRYETFKTLAAWKEHVAEAHKSIEAARPLLDRYKIPLGLENHKDWTADELFDLMMKYAGPYFGVCLDFGNNIALLDNPMGVIEQLAPFTVCVHLKDMSTEQAPAGFAISEVILGTGYLDMPKAVSVVRRAKPDMRFSLEMITRDPLQVPCLDDRYWATFPDRNGIYLARTLRFVQAHQPFGALPAMSQLPHEQQLKLENDNVIACIKFARESLGL